MSICNGFTNLSGMRHSNEGLRGTTKGTRCRDGVNVLWCRSNLGGFHPCMHLFSLEGGTSFL